MSLHIFSDENVTGDKSTENCDFLFSPPELTGRSSVLRLSQKENVPPKSTAKAVKVSSSGPCVLSTVSLERLPCHLLSWQLTELPGQGTVLPEGCQRLELLNRCPLFYPTGDFSNTSAGPTDTQDLKSQRG